MSAGKIPPKSHLVMVLALLLLVILTGCLQSPSAAGIIVGEATANPVLIATAQADQYMRDAAATLDTRNLTQQAVAFEIQETSLAHNATAQAQQTRDALSLALTADSATYQAQETVAAATARANASSTIQAKQDAAATSTAVSLATINAINATRQAIELEQVQAEARQAQMTTIAISILMILGITLVVILSGLFLWKIIPVLVNRIGLIRYGQHGNPLLLTSQNGRTVITDPMKMHQAAITVDENGDVIMTELTPNDLQTFVTGGALRILLEQVQNAPGHPQRLPEQTNKERRLGPYSSSETKYFPTHRTPPIPLQASVPPQQTALNQSEQMPLPDSFSWQSIQSNVGEGFVLGMGHNSLIRIDFTQTPHILLSGSSGAGKTRRALRPLVAQALVQGYVVALLNESAADFSPFYDHPNAFIIHGGVERFIALLKSVISEMERRESILRQARVSEWRRLPTQLNDGPPILIVVDEVLSLAMLMSPREQKMFWGLLTTYASRARKLSMGSIGALTDPSYRVLGNGLNWREQCNARISFRVAKANVSRAALDTEGAERLAEGHFLAMLKSSLVQGVAPNPTDEQLIDYLNQYRVAPICQQDWLLVPESSEPLEPVQTSSRLLEPPSTTELEPVPTLRIPFDSNNPPTTVEKNYIRKLHTDGASKNRICQQVYGFKNGKVFRWVSNAIDEG